MSDAVRGTGQGWVAQASLPFLLTLWMFTLHTWVYCCYMLLCPKAGLSWVCRAVQSGRRRPHIQPAL